MGLMPSSWPARAWALLACTLPLPSLAATTYTVGPGGGRHYATLATLFAQVNLQPGDVVLVDGNATYTASGSVGFRMDEDDGGAPGNPVRIIGVAIAGKRPHLTMSQGDHVLKIERAHHVLIQGFEISSGTGGNKSCVFSEADDVVLRDLLIHDCKAHGLLAADHNAGSLTLEYSEIRHAGSGQLRHPIYVTSDPVLYPAAVFRMQFNYVHSGNGGNLLKSRHARNEIYANWFEGATYQELELIGPDCEAWDGVPPPVQTYADVVGNVIVHTSSWANVVRAGGDLNGRSRGLLRMVNNTVLIDRPGSANAVYVQLGLRGLDMHNNLIHQVGGKPAIVRENTSADTPTCGDRDTRPWVDGVRRVSGGNNWVQTGASAIPSAVEWMTTLQAADPQLGALPARDLRPHLDSPVRGAANALPPDAPGAPFPQPLPIPLFDPPPHAPIAPGGERARALLNGVSIGAWEPALPLRVQGAMPLIPGIAAAPAASPSRSPNTSVPAKPSTRALTQRAAPAARKATPARCTPVPTSGSRRARSVSVLQAWWEVITGEADPHCRDR